MRTLAMVVEYDGTHFAGFQRQAQARTVAGELERALGMLFGHAVPVVCAGRTDAGVHAAGQVISCKTSSEIELARIPMAATALLHKIGCQTRARTDAGFAVEIAVLRAVERSARFSARRDALARRYRYRILNRSSPSPLNFRRVLHARASLDVRSMAAAAELLVGEHDFTAFCASLPESSSTRRTIAAASILKYEDFIDIWITADSFLHQMVRIIVGTLIEIGRGKRGIQDICRVMASGKREEAGFTAPPHALYLEHVQYAEPI